MSVLSQRFFLQEEKSLDHEIFFVLHLNKSERVVDHFNRTLREAERQKLFKSGRFIQLN